MRSAGMPSNMAASEPAAAATARVMNRSTFQRLTRLPATMAPTPTSANCPRLIWPPQPVSTTRLTATRPQIAMMDSE